MNNISTSVKGTKLIIEVDLSKRLGPSNSGKTIMVASSEGPQTVAPGIKMNLTAYTKEGVVAS